MKFLFDIFPVIAFFIAFKIPNDPKQAIALATAVAIIASLLQLIVYWFKNKRFEQMHVITFVMILLLGGATLLFGDERFIKWKPTVVNWFFAGALLVSAFIGKKNLIRKMMESNLNLPDKIWARLNFAWAVFFVIVGCLNLYVAFNFPTATWVNFKLFGILGLTFLFAIIQAIFLSKYLQPENTEET